MKKNGFNFDSYEFEEFILYMKNLHERKSQEEIKAIIKVSYKKTVTELYKMLDVVMDKEDIKKMHFILDAIEMKSCCNVVFSVLNINDILELVSYVKAEVSRELGQLHP
jgi:hypothetical protein